MKKLFCAAVALGLLTAFAGSANAAKEIQLWVAADGTAYLENTTDAAVSFDGYTIESEGNKLDPAGWSSIADQVLSNTGGVIAALGPGALSFGEANPGAGNLSELNLANAASLGAHAKFAIGKPLLGLPSTDAGFSFKLAGVQNGAPGDITGPGVPEPSTFVLGAIGLVGLVGLARRRRAA